MRKLFRYLLITLFAFSLLACDNKQPVPKVVFANTDITGANYAQGFELTDQSGQKRSLADYKGKVVLVFFGFTHCPDVCPTTLSEMAGVMKQLGADASRLQVLFVTVDPERDTQSMLASFVPAFDPSFVGLYGDKAATDKVIKDFKLFVQKVPNKTGKDYSVDHTAGSYVFDPQGRIRLFVRHGQGGDAILKDIRLLLSGA